MIHRVPALLAGLVLFLAAAAHAAPVPVWTRYEAPLEAAQEVKEPLHQVDVVVELTSPSGKVNRVGAFWDGFRVWRFRFAPDEPGTWQWRSRATPVTAGLHDRSGSFEAKPYTGKNPLYRRGVLRLSPDRLHFQHADGTPFFWLADTAWNGVMKADAKSWDTYLRDRVSKGFNVVQYVTTQWRTASGNADGRPAFYGTDKISIDPVFFQWMDERVDAINEHGLVAAPVLIWAIAGGTAKLNPANILPDDQVTALARYMVARYGAHHVVWFLAGDADYRGDKATRWLKIGRAVFGDKPARLATMHPGGRMWVAEEFKKEPWFAFNGYQSSHGGTDETLRWITEGPPAKQWKTDPVLAHINLEPCYEAHVARPSDRVFDARDVRRASYWSVLVHPPAGVTYGAQGIWSWETKRVPPMTHPYTGVAPTWSEAMKLPGATSMKHLAAFFRALPWWQLRPAPELLAAQPGTTAASKFIAAARTEDGKLAVIYVPEDGQVSLAGDKIQGARAEWHDPVTGARRPAGRVAGSGPLKAPKPNQDWLLVLRSDDKS